MRFTLQHPLASRACSPAMLEPANVIRLAQATEAAGLDALAFTEHPAPSQKWLSSGGHDSLDPLTALAFCAAATQRIALMPYLLVLPYRNPVLAAKQIATLDVLSGGRVILGVGNGYLRSEFSALGVDFDERSALLDEGLEVLRGIWTQDSFAFTGRHFRVLAQTAHPRPVQQPSPPVWIGGNSASARDRVVRAGQGWTPLLLDGPAAQMLRTPPIPTVTDLRVAVQDLHARVERAGRDPAGIAVQIEGAGTTAMDGDPAHRLEQIAELAAAGVTWLVVEPPGDDIDHALEVIAAYGRDVVQQLPDPLPHLIDTEA